MDIKKNALQTIKAHSMLQHGDNIVIALSGGADSVALLYIMKELQHSLGIARIYAAHINHNLRPAAYTDEAFCINLCHKLGIPIKTYDVDIKDQSKKLSLTIEEAGRFFRYKFLHQACTDFGVPAAKIATGHHQNDNAETVILNLTRGAGLKGLCGIPPTNGNIRLIRPLISVSRIEIEKYLAAKNAEYVTDATNAENDYARNRVRNIILPALETLNQSAVQNIAKNTTWLRDEENYLNSIAMDTYTKISSSDDVSVIMDAKKLTSQNISIARRVVRIALEKAGIEDITSSHITAVLELAQKKSGHEVHLANKVARRGYSSIYIEDKKPLQKMCNYQLSIPSRTYISEIDAWLELTLQKNSVKCSKNQILLCTKLFDYDKVREELILRPRKAGDKIVFSSRNGNFTKKLQDYFTDQKLPKDQRDLVPVLASGNDVLWILDEKGPTSAKYECSKNCNPLVVSLWRDAND